MDVALIERALKDASKLITALYYHEDFANDVNLAQEQITCALMELRKVPTTCSALAQAIRDEREACAQIADGYRCGDCGMDGKVAAAIRARSKGER